MNKIFETYKSDILSVTIIIAIVAILYLLTRVSRTWLIKKIKEKLPGSPLKPIRLIKHVLTLLWLVLGIIALSFIFIDVDNEAIFKEYFKRSGYLGVVSVTTIIAVMISNLWFKQKVKERITNKCDFTSYRFLRYIAVFFIVIIGVVLASFAFPSLKGVAQTALGSAGVLALIVGFAAQEALANITGGLFIILFKPFKIGDTVKVSDAMVGTVNDITLRHTVIRNYDNKMIVIPNAIINKEKLINYNLGENKCCERIEIGISYDSDIDLAKRIMQEECENHPLIFDNRLSFEKIEGQPIVKTALIELKDFSMTIRAWAWSSHYSDSFALKCDVLESIKKRFDKEGIVIPFPHRTVVMKQGSTNANRI